MIKKMHGSIKSNSINIALSIAKLLSGGLLGLAIAIVVKEIIGLGSFGFIFVIVMMTGAFMKMSGKWKFTGVVLFNLFCVMTALLLRMYIYVAPGQ